MEPGRRTRRLADFGRALRIARGELAATGGMSSEELRSRQRRMLADIVRHARTASPFYRERYRGLDHDEDVELSALPTVTKAELMERFDDWVTDPRLKLAELETHLEGLAGDGLHLGQYRVVASSGSTGGRCVLVYSRRDWMVNLANFARLNEQFVGIHPRVPRRLRAAAVSATSPLHISARTSLTIDVGVYRVLRLDARRPLPELAAALDAFQPEVIGGYPSMLALLADEQLAGCLQVRPRKVMTVSEVRTPEMAETIRAAWGVAPFDWYGISEGGVLAGDCEHHLGMHIFEDLFLVENVDENGRAVPDGEVGHKLLLTNLFNRTQPIIRYELTDMVAIDSGPCPCGRPLRRVISLEGRSDDILRLRDAAGGHVAIHPVALRSPFTAISEVRQYRVVHDVDGLHVLVALREGGARRRRRSPGAGRPRHHPCPGRRESGDARRGGRRHTRTRPGSRGQVQAHRISGGRAPVWLLTLLRDGTSAACATACTRTTCSWPPWRGWTSSPGSTSTPSTWMVSVRDAVSRLDLRTSCAPCSGPWASSSRGRVPCDRHPSPATTWRPAVPSTCARITRRSEIGPPVVSCCRS